MKRASVILTLCLGGTLQPACASDTSERVAEGIFGDPGSPLPSASAEQLEAFERGRAIGLRRFTPAEGLGPELNVGFCLGCHEKPNFGGSASHYRDFSLVGDELSANTVVPRGKNGVQRQFSLESGRAASDPLTNISARRNPIPFFGAGLLAEISDAEILSRADPTDLDGNGISGRVNYDGTVVGRFGRKAQASRLELFVRGPLFNHMGITSEPLSSSRRADLPTRTPSAVLSAMDGSGSSFVKQSVIEDAATVDLDAAPDPELSESELFDLISFTSLLAAPEPDEPNAQTMQGAVRFHEVGCDDCHVRALHGPRGAIPAYTDLLLHDMGEELADDFPMGSATGREFRTQPLWGVLATSPYLHDGRAQTIDEAVRWHGGEARRARDGYAALNPNERSDLLAFIESLGGASQASAGLLPPNSRIPSGENAGAPLPGLDAEERMMFERGRALFDRDFGFAEGLGPLFNGDACRSCHFDPVIGGAGPLGVDVIRQGIFTDGGFRAPRGGTALPRHAVDGTRPEPDPEANFFEPRQTPSTLGLGLLQDVPRAYIEALADPGDADEDGISGRAHVLGDGRLGRFGWKATIPSIREFVRDALGAEMGMTVRQEPGTPFGMIGDDDEAPDPEADSDIVDAITMFIELLAPPPRSHADMTLEGRGTRVFEDIGCSRCHLPTLPTAQGIDADAYTDLLLHDVARAGRLGIEQGGAHIHEFRTPPLWGLARSAPYLHDGRASTVVEAIEDHAGEATRSREAFEGLDSSDQEALIAFLRSL